MMNKPRYKIIWLVSLFLTTFSLSGCWHIMQPEDLATISLMGIDKRKDEYVITVQILNPGGISSGATGESASAEKPVRILVSRGKTIIEAIHEANRYNPGHHFMGHLGAIVISEDIARAGMETLMDTLARNTEFMETADLYIARDMTAEDFEKNNQSNPLSSRSAAKDGNLQHEAHLDKANQTESSPSNHLL